MGKIILKTGIAFLLLFVTEAGCEKKAELPLYHAKGSIIAVTSQCHSDMVVIEVENPKGVGKKGTFNCHENADEIITSYLFLIC